MFNFLKKQELALIASQEELIATMKKTIESSNALLGSYRQLVVAYKKTEELNKRKGEVRR